VVFIMHMPGHEPLTGQGSYSCDNLLLSQEYSAHALQSDPRKAEAVVRIDASSLTAR